MIRFNSIIEERGKVQFPELSIERHYMIPFFQKEGLPPKLKKWQPTVNEMLQGIETDCPIFIMIDSRYVESGNLLRRPGPHIDGNWLPKFATHNNGNHSSRGGLHSPTGIHRNKIEETSQRRTPKRNPKPKRKFDTHILDGIGYDEAIILASNISACIGWCGTIFGDIDSEGGFTGNVKCANQIDLKSHTVYAGNSCMLHESIPQSISGIRQLVRLNVPGWSPQKGNVQ